MRKTYYGYWGNNSSYNREPYIFTSQKDAKKTMRAIARGNNTGSGAWWRIQDKDNEVGAAYPVAEGYTR